MPIATGSNFAKKAALARKGIVIKNKKKYNVGAKAATKSLAKGGGAGSTG